MRAKPVKRSQRAPGGDLEDRATLVVPAYVRCSVKVPVGGLHQASARVVAVSDVEAMERGQSAAGGDFEDRTKATRALRPTQPGCPIEVPVGGLHQRGVRLGPVRATTLRTKAVECRELCGRGNRCRHTK